MTAPRLARLFGVLALGALAACTSIERAALPEPGITDQSWTVHSPGSTATVDHSAWDAFLATHLSLGADGIARVDYAALGAEDRAALDAYLERLSATDPAVLDRPEQLAFWINLYNAKTVDLVLEAYPVGSIRRVRAGLLPTGPWDEAVVRVDGRALSLNDIEHAIIRPIWQDPRIHYAVNCAALGCPNLRERAYTGATVDAMLAENARAYVNDPRGFRFEGERLTASKIYAWFAEDFGGTEAGVLAHAAEHAEPALAARLRAVDGIDAYAYDWGLNEATGPASARAKAATGRAARAPAASGHRDTGGDAPARLDRANLDESFQPGM